MGQSKIKNQRKTWKKRIQEMAGSDFDKMIAEMKVQKRKIRSQKIAIIILAISCFLMSLFLTILLLLLDISGQ